PFGTVAAEAAAAGVPVVASATGGLSEVVLDGETGVLVPPGDVRALAEAVGGLLASPERLRAMGRRAHVEAERFAPGRYADRVEALLPLDLRRLGADVHHVLAIYRAPLRAGVPTVVTVHDVIPLMWPDEYLRTGAIHRMLYAAARRARRVIVPSRAVHEDVRRHLGIPAERIAVVHSAADEHFVPTDASELRGKL